ncbi:helicase-like protein [Sphaerospermopsis reniformis]|uniref:Helicase-like protein n=1 Tax=Sphaerospermopsis reniformis TaxID=531300 RepID=A0A480A563_9CYAN|nr:hypothetical protein [Sphaerospermopsis reniformis]GCL39969.1 helicase-like protein [Sphaerospermopsis reniformis]
MKLKCWVSLRQPNLQNKIIISQSPITSPQSPVPSPQSPVPKNMESQDVRTYIQKALKLDLIGPTSQDLEYQTEILNQPPSKWYLTGFLVPFGAPVEMKYDPTADDTIEVITNKDIAEDAKTPETAAARKAPFPSSIGLSFLVPATTEKLEVTVEWGDYQPQEREIETSAENNRPVRKLKRQSVYGFEDVLISARLDVIIRARDSYC